MSAAMIVWRRFALARAPARAMRSLTALFSACTASALRRSRAFLTWSRALDWTTSMAAMSRPFRWPGWGIGPRSSHARSLDRLAVPEQVVPRPEHLAEGRARHLLELRPADRDRGMDLLDLRERR